MPRGFAHESSRNHATWRHDERTGRRETVRARGAENCERFARPVRIRRRRGGRVIPASKIVTARRRGGAPSPSESPARPHLMKLSMGSGGCRRWASRCDQCDSRRARREAADFPRADHTQPEPARQLVAAKAGGDAHVASCSVTRLAPSSEATMHRCTWEKTSPRWFARADDARGAGSGSRRARRVRGVCELIERSS